MTLTDDLTEYIEIGEGLLGKGFPVKKRKRKKSSERLATESVVQRIKKDVEGPALKKEF